MNKESFTKKAKELGYADEWIKEAIEKLKELNEGYGFDYSYEDIVLQDVHDKKKEEDKFSWEVGDVIMFRPKKEKVQLNGCIFFIKKY